MTKGEPLFGEEQQVVGILETVRDITEKKLLEEKLEKNNESCARAQGLADTGSWKIDITHGTSYISEETYRIFGVTSEQYDGTYEEFLKLIHPDDMEMLQNILENPPDEQCFDMEFRILKSDGSVRYVYQLVEIIPDKDGIPAFINGTIQDITEKKEIAKGIGASTRNNQ